MTTRYVEHWCKQTCCSPEALFNLYWLMKAELSIICAAMLLGAIMSRGVWLALWQVPSVCGPKPCRVHELRKGVAKRALSKVTLSSHNAAFLPAVLDACTLRKLTLLVVKAGSCGK